MIENIHCRMGQGAGDIIGQINTAHAWASYYQRPVHLSVHWGKQYDGDYKVVESDPETICERYQHVYERMWNNHMVSFEHVFKSDMFAFLEKLFEGSNDQRRKERPKRWIFESGDMPNDGMHRADVPFCNTGGPEWKWDRNPMSGKNIIFWNSNANADNIKDFKSVPFDSYNWQDIRLSLEYMFPKHNVIEVTYRDDFRYVHDLIADCAFCIGYDGMWHIVARNFGKMFVTATDDIVMAHNVTNPLAPIFRDPAQFFEFLHNCAYTEGFLQREQELAMRYHTRKVSMMTHRGATRLDQINAV